MGIVRIALRVAEIDDEVVGVLCLGIQLEAAEEQVAALETVEPQILAALGEVPANSDVVRLAPPDQVREAALTGQRRRLDRGEAGVHRRLPLGLGKRLDRGDPLAELASQTILRLGRRHLGLH